MAALEVEPDYEFYQLKTDEHHIQYFSRIITFMEKDIKRGGRIADMATWQIHQLIEREGKEAALRMIEVVEDALKGTEERSGKSRFTILARILLTAGKEELELPDLIDTPLGENNRIGLARIDIERSRVALHEDMLRSFNLEAADTIPFATHKMYAMLARAKGSYNSVAGYAKDEE